jgi:hypothetical protein
MNSFNHFNEIPIEPLFAPADSLGDPGSTEITTETRRHGGNTARWHLSKVPCNRYDGFVAQVTIYLPDPVAAEVRRQAKRANRPVSTFIAEVVAEHTRPSGWPRWFVALLSKGEADLVEPDDPPPEDVEPIR